MSVASRLWIRRTTGAAMILLLLVIGVLIARRVSQLRAPIESLIGGELVSDSGDETVGIYTGFEFVERVAGRDIFRLMSKRTLGLSSGWHEIEGVRLQFYRDGEVGSVLTCSGARFNIETRDAELSGNVRIRLPSGATLTSDAGDFRARDRVFRADSPVTFVSGATFGQAGRATYDLERDLIELDGGISIFTEDGVALQASKGAYDRSKGTIEFSRGAIIDFPTTRVDAPYAVVTLEAGEGPPRILEMSGNVVVTGYSSHDDGMIEARMERVVATRDSSGRWQVDASSSVSWISVRFIGGEGYFEREVRTWLMRAVIGNGGLVNLRAENGVCVREVPTEGSVRWAEAETGRVWFDDGQATDIELLRDVVVSGDGIEGRGYRARMSPQAGLIMLHGDPVGPERVLLVSERGRLSADQAQLFNAEGRSEARGNVQGEIREVSLVGGGAGSDQKPAHFASESLDVTENGAVYRLQGSARLWQGNRLLLADDVVFHHADDVTLRAAGHVRTTLPATEVGLDTAVGDVVVVARSLDYDEGQGTAIYRGNVRYSDPEHTLAASELRLSFDEANEITDVEAEGAVEMVILESGRRMTGQMAHRSVAEQLVTMTGSPVRLSDPEGNEVSGSSLTWNQADGTVAVTGGTETIYYPEERP